MELTIQQTSQFLKSAEDVLILCHRNPDGDTLGSGFGLCRALLQMGKRARVLCSDLIPEKLRYLSEGLRFEPFEPKTIVSSDIADEQLFGDGLEAYVGKVGLAIDHHPSNTRFAQRLLLDAKASATCELMFELLKEMGVTFTKDIADCLYTGLATDTGCFVYTSTTSHTHRVAAELLDAGCDYKRINKVLFETKSVGIMALEREALNSLEFHFDNHVALMVITRDMLRRAGISEAELDGVASIPRKIEGVEVGITIKERDDGEYKISLRSGETINVSNLCRTLGGGGHARAAGCTLYGSLDEAKALILGVVGRALLS